MNNIAHLFGKPSPPKDAPNVTISVRNLSVVYSNGHRALSDASFGLRGGTICGLVGVNGSGKSTLFKAMMGFVRPAAGEVLVCGMASARALKHNTIAYVPQSEEVDWNFPVSVADVVMMGRYGHMNFLRMATGEDHRVVARAIERVGLGKLRQRQIGELSGGQKKRVFLARALAQGAPVLLLDEPFTGVDINTETTIIALLRELRAEGHLMLVSTHNLVTLADFCDQAVLLNGGVVAAGETKSVLTEANLAEAFGHTHGTHGQMRRDQTTRHAPLEAKLPASIGDLAARRAAAARGGKQL